MDKTLLVLTLALRALSLHAPYDTPEKREHAQKAL